MAVTFECLLMPMCIPVAMKTTRYQWHRHAIKSRTIPAALLRAILSPTLVKYWNDFTALYRRGCATNWFKLKFTTCSKRRLPLGFPLEAFYLVKHCLYTGSFLYFSSVRYIRVLGSFLIQYFTISLFRFSPFKKRCLKFHCPTSPIYL